jgi:hypothetical protein
MSYNVYLLELEQPSRDHHALFVTTDDQPKGKLYHVNGNPRLGMYHDVGGDFDLDKTKKPFRKSKIGTFPRSRIQDFESLALTVPSPNVLSGSSSAEDCQHWVGNLIGVAVKAGVIETSE